MGQTRKVWQDLIRQWERSGKSQKEFAAERQIRVGTLQSWMYRLRREKEEKAAPILPVGVMASSTLSARGSQEQSATVEVMLLRFASGTASELIADVVSRLRRC